MSCDSHCCLFTKATAILCDVVCSVIQCGANTCKWTLLTSHQHWRLLTHKVTGNRQLTRVTSLGIVQEVVVQGLPDAAAIASGVVIGALLQQVHPASLVARPCPLGNGACSCPVIRPV